MPDTTSPEPTHPTACKPDAVRAPLGFAIGSDSTARLRHLKAEFAPLLGAASIVVFNQGTEYFIAPDDSQTLNFPYGRGRDGQPRYTWSDRGDGVSYGRLVEGG
jgi:hypothetical protein